MDNSENEVLKIKKEKKGKNIVIINIRNHRMLKKLRFRIKPFILLEQLINRLQVFAVNHFDQVVFCVEVIGKQSALHTGMQCHRLNRCFFISVLIEFFFRRVIDQLFRFKPFCDAQIHENTS